MLLSMTAIFRPGLTAPVSRGRRPRTITVRKLPHRTTHGYLMMLREKHPGFTFSLPSSSISERREIVFWPAQGKGVVWCWGCCGAQLCGWDYRSGSWRELAWLPKPPGARLLAGGEAAGGEDAGRALHPADYPRLTTPELLMVLGPGSWGRGSCWGL